jgi:hypothetical protein
MSMSGRIDLRGVASHTVLGTAWLLCAASAAGEPPVAQPVAQPLGGGDSVVLEPAPPPASASRRRPVFVCHEQGVPVYSDRPCGANATERGLVVDSRGTGSVATTLPPVPRAATRPRRGAAPAVMEAEAARETGCSALQRRLDQINDRMRSGYSAREAARLWQRWRDAKEQLRAARC